jgi:hypothetical protein
VTEYLSINYINCKDANTNCRRQIADGAITNAKIKAGAAIESNKLADGVNFIKKDGSVAMTGTLNMGNQPISNVLTPSAATDAANKSYVDTVVGNVSATFTQRNCKTCNYS